MNKKLSKTAILSLLSTFCLTQSTAAYTSSYMEFIDVESLNPTLSQICTDMVDHESARSQTSTSLDLSSNAILFGKVTIGIGVAAVRSRCHSRSRCKPPSLLVSAIHL